MVVGCGLGMRLALLIMCLIINIMCLWSDMWPGKEGSGLVCLLPIRLFIVHIWHVDCSVPASCHCVLSMVLPLFRSLKESGEIWLDAWHSSYPKDK